jgi:hypothetical protein
MDKLKSSPANITILAAGAVMLIASFLPFLKINNGGYSITSTGAVSSHSVSYSAWSSHLFIIVTLPAILGIAMAVVVALVAFAPNVNLPERVAGFTWDQVHLVLGFQAAIMMLALLIQDTSGADKGIGLYLMLLAGIALLVGAILRTRESQPTTA